MSDEYVVKEFHTESGYRAEILFDDNPQNPRQESDSYNGIMACHHSRYDLGDEKIDPGDFESEAELIASLDAYCILPLYLYDHSGLSMSVGSGSGNPFTPFDPGGWDSGQVGFIYTTKDKLAAGGHDPDNLPTVEQCEEWLRGEVTEYDHYLTGQVFGYRIIAPDGEEIDACWGFYGDECVKEEAQAALGHAAEHDPLDMTMRKRKKWFANDRYQFARLIIEGPESFSAEEAEIVRNRAQAVWEKALEDR
jgi:hypothetical protein